MPYAIVTGAGSGVGRAVARGLLADGFEVALVGRRVELLNETAAGHEESALVLPGDVTLEDSVGSVFEVIHGTWGRLDVLFNNAGWFGPSGEIDAIGLADWQAAVDVNLTGAFLCARAAYALMKTQHPRGGRIINNGSISAHVPRPQTVAYAATKHAITGLTRSLALDGRVHGIACGQIDIGNAHTEMISGVVQGSLQPDGSIRPEPTFDPDVVAEVVVRLARLPLDVNVPFLTMIATGMPFLGRG